MTLLLALKKVLNELLPARTAEEKARRLFLAVRLTSTEIAIDCGANVGDITELLSRSGATVYAFEPNPHAFMVLERRFSGRQNVHCFQQAVLDCNDTRRLYFHECSDKDELHWSTGSSLLDYKSNVLRDKFIDTTVIDLSDFILALRSRVRLLKMDVEGVECAILKKLVRTGTIHQIDHVFVETHEKKVPELRAETDELRQMLRTMKLTHVNLDWT